MAVGIYVTTSGFDAFGATLMPILSGLGVEMAGEPMVAQVQNVVDA
jgi:hypothetical protein